MLTQSQSILVVHLFSRKKTHQPFNSIYWSPWDLLGISKHEIPIQNHIVFDTINNRGRAKNIENSFVITSNFTILLIVTYDSVCTIITLRFENHMMLSHYINEHVNHLMEILHVQVTRTNIRLHQICSDPILGLTSKNSFAFLHETRLYSFRG